MDLETAVEIVVARTGHQRYRQWADPSRSDYDPERLPGLIRLAEAYAAGAPPTPAPPEPPQPPSLLRKAVNLVEAVARDLSAGMPRVSDELYAARLAVCEPCGQRLPGGTCAGCGCNLSVKARWGAETCPEGKWPADPS